MLRELVEFPTKSSNPNSFIAGNLVIPDNPIGIVVFAHGSGSSKHSKRNQLVSEILNNNNIATLLFDLLSDDEQAFDSQLENMAYKIPGVVLNKFNISLLARRLSMATDWVLSNPHTEKLQVSYFAASTGGATALIAACRYKIVSIIIRSGRTDLVDNNVLDQIISPCLFIVGSKEKLLLDISKQTMKKLRNAEEKELRIIQNASHLFEEEGSMKEVAEVANGWVKRHFS